MNYALLGLVVVLLVVGLVAFGVGHRRWSWGTLIAAILVLLTAAGYLYVASRLAAYEWSWQTFVRGKQAQLSKVRDALMPDASAGGRLRPMAGGDGGLESKSLATLEAERDRWQRALRRIDTWRGRFWPNASFEAPKNDAATGTITIPFVKQAAPPPPDGDPAAAVEPEKPAPPAAGPIDPGATVYLFEDTPANEGGRYLGAFLVESATIDAGNGRFVLTVKQTAARDKYDEEAWSRAADGVTVYETLPVDRWMAFSSTRRDSSEGGVMPQPERLTIEQLEGILEERERRREFLDEYGRHEKAIDKDDWERIRRGLDEGTEPLGSYWAEVKVTKPDVVAAMTTPPGGAADERPGLADEGSATFDLQTAFALADKEAATIERVFYRRPLRDAETLLHGTTILSDGGAARDGKGISAEGVAGLAAVLRREIDSIEESTKRLAASRRDITAEIEATENRRSRLADDAGVWGRDAAAAEQTATAFTTELAATQARLTAAEKAIVALGAELRAGIARLTQRIDVAAPAPAEPAAAP